MPVASRIRLPQLLGIVAVALAWLLAGLFEREPWKADEAYTIGLVYSIVEHGAWLVPTLGGEPFLEKPPLVFWIGAIAAWVGDGLLPMHVAARLANIVLSLGTFALVWRAASIALDTRRAWQAVWILAASPAMLVSTRYLTADLGLRLGAGFVTLGMVQLPSGRRTAGALVGLGASIGLLSKGLILPGVTAVTWAALVVLSPTWRSAFAWRQAGIATLAFALAGLPWPVTLWLDSPAHFHTWFVINNLQRFFGGHGLGPPNDHLRTLAALAAFLLPAWPIALAALVRWRAGLSTRSPLAGPAMLSIVWFAMLMVSSSVRVIYALPALVPLAVCAAVPLEVPAAQRPRDIGRSATLALALMLVPALLALAFRLFGTPMDPSPALSGGHLALAAAALAVGAWAWLAGWRPRWPQAVAGGLALGLTVALTLFLDAADQRSGFRQVLREVAKSVPPGECLASLAFGESERGMLEYYGGRTTRRIEVDPDAQTACAWRLNQRRVGEQNLPDCPQGWSDRRYRRPGDDQEFQLCARPPSG